MNKYSISVGDAYRRIEIDERHDYTGRTRCGGFLRTQPLSKGETTFRVWDDRSLIGSFQKDLWGEGWIVKWVCGDPELQIDCLSADEAVEKIVANYQKFWG